MWLRLYQEEMRGQVPSGGDDPVWWTLRRPFRPLSYHAARAMFGRANAALGANWSLHDLRHAAAYRMARDPLMPLTGVQWVLGHVHLSTTQIYVAPAPDDVVQSVLAYHRRQQDGQAAPPPGPAAGYRAGDAGRLVRQAAMTAGPAPCLASGYEGRSGRGCVPARMPRCGNGSRRGPSRTSGRPPARTGAR